MKKRILSLILAVCMVAVAVPALLSPVVAADAEGFTTRLSALENWPSYTSKTSFDGFNGNWSVGRFKNGIYDEATFLAPNTNIISADGAGKQWTSTGLFLNEARFILTSTPYMTNASANYAFAYTYNVFYEGTVDLSLDALLAEQRTDITIGEGETAYMYFAVFVNETMIFPTPKGSILNTEDFALVSTIEDVQNHPNAGLLNNVDVNIGDKIYFVAARNNVNYGSMTPVVTFHDGYEIIPSRMVHSYGPDAAGWPAARNLSGTGELLQTDLLWSLGNYNTTSNTFTEYTAQTRNTLGVWASANDATDFTKNNGIVISHTGSLNGAFMFGSNETNEKPAYKGTVKATGTVEFSVIDTALYLGASNTNAAKNAAAAIDVYVNGAKKGTISLKSDDKGTVTLESTVKNVSVYKGDVILYVASNAEGVKFLNAQPKLFYSNITSFMSKATDKKYDMEMTDAAVVVGDKIGLQFNAFATRDTYKDFTSANVYVWDATVTGEKTLDNATTMIPMDISYETFAFSATYDAFAPKEMVDSFTAQVVVLKDGETLGQSDQTTFTVADVAQAQYDATYEDSEKALMAAVLNYGAYAQKYFNYKTDNLANKGLPTDVATIDPDKYQYFANLDMVLTPNENQLTYSELAAFSLFLDDSISVCLYIDIDEYEKITAEKMYIQFGYSESDYAKNDGIQLSVDRESGRAVIENVSLKDLSRLYYLRFVSEERVTLASGSRLYKFLGCTWTYSVESFAARMMDSTEESLPELLCALMELGKLAQ